MSVISGVIDGLFNELEYGDSSQRRTRMGVRWNKLKNDRLVAGSEDNNHALGAGVPFCSVTAAVITSDDRPSSVIRNVRDCPALWPTCCPARNWAR